MLLPNKNDKMLLEISGGNMRLFEKTTREFLDLASKTVPKDKERAISTFSLEGDTSTVKPAANKSAKSAI